MVEPSPLPAAGASPPTRGATRRNVLRGALGAGAALGAPALLTGCGTAEASGRTLKFWQFYGPQSSPDPAQQAQSKWFVDLVDKWNATHDVKVELVFIPGPVYQQQGTKLPTAFAAGSGPDIFLVSPGDFLRYANGGVLADLTDYLTPEVIKDYGSSLDSWKVDGRVYSLPMEIEPLAMFYDVKGWEKAGLSEGDIPATWDEMLDAGDKLRSGGQAGLVFETGPGYYQNFTWYPWMWQGGGEVLNKDGSVAFDSKAARQALALWQDAVNAGVAPRTLPGGGDQIAGLKSGLVGMWQHGIWNVSSFKAFAPDYKYGVFKLPVPPGGRYTTALGGWSFCANKQSANPEAAAEFVAWALGSMEEDCIGRMVDWCTKAKSDVAPRESALQLGTKQGGYDFWAMKKFKDDIAPGGRAEPRYPPVVYKAISDAIQGTMLAGRGVAGEADKAAQSIESYTKSYEGASLI